MSDPSRRRRLAVWVATISVFGAMYGAVAAPAVQAAPVAKAAPASTTSSVNGASSSAYLTVLIGRALASKAIGCQTPAGMLTLDQVVQQLYAMGITVTAPVIPARTQATATSCIANNLYPSWSDLKGLATSYQLTAVSASLNYANMTSITSTAQLFKQSCGSLPTFIANGFHRAWGLFAYPDNLYSPAIQTNVVQNCFAFGRTYVNPHYVNSAQATNSQAMTTSPWLQVTDDIGGGRCNVVTLPCYTEGTSSTGRYLSPSALHALTNVALGTWTSLQAYTFVQGSSTSGAIQWDCTDPNWIYHWTSLFEVYCWNDFVSALTGISPSVTITDPATVAEAWGRIPTPMVTIASLSPASLAATTFSTKLAWSAEENGTYSVLVGGLDCTSGTQVAGGAYTRSPSPISLTLLRSALPGGTNPMRVCLTNDAGHVGSASVTVTSVPVPTVASIAPAATNLTVRPTITITGANFTVGAAVKVGGASATGVVVQSSTVITAMVPSKPGGLAGTYNVVVTDSLGASSVTPADDFTYEVAPSVSAVSPAVGPIAGGTPITISGANFYPDATVTVGGVAVTGVVVASSTSITATTPAGSGPADVVVSDAGGVSPTNPLDVFTYEAVPSVTSVSPAFGPVAGGTVITITGTGFASEATVTIDGVLATGVVIDPSAMSISAVTPAPVDGTTDNPYDVIVTDAGGMSAASVADRFTYEAAPSITAVTLTDGTTPATGPVAGGTAILITGSDFYADATVSIDGALATGIVLSADGTTITAVTPRDPDSTSGDMYDVVVQEPGGVATAPDAFTYQ